MNKKIIVAAISQETCSFNREPTVLEDFMEIEGQAVADAAPQDGVIGGFCSVIKPSGYLPEGIISCQAMSGGALSAEVFSRLKNKLLTGIKAIGRPDTVFLALHGAMQAENNFDTEGTIISEVRELVGKQCLIGVMLDHHANVTQKMVTAADVIAGYETQPHHLA